MEKSAGGGVSMVRRLPAALLTLFVFGFVALAIPVFAAVLGLAMITAAVASVVWSAVMRQRDARRWSSITSFYTLTPEQFERHVAQTFQYQGYSTVLTPRTGDQGVDVIARKGDQVIAIQCKRYADPAPNTAVQAVHSGSKYYGCNEAALVCLGGFSRAAAELAGAVSVRLIDGNLYADMVHAATNGNGTPALKALPSLKAAVLATLALFVGAALISYGLAGHSATTIPAAAAPTSVSTVNVNRFLTVVAIIMIAIGISSLRKKRRRKHRWL